MERHLLVTISDNPGRFYGLGFLTRFFTVKDGLRLTLLHISAQAAAVWPEEMNYESLTRRDSHLKEMEEKGRTALEEAEKLLLAGGFAKNQMRKKLITGGISKDKIILQEGEVGLYDAVILGQRGYDRLRDILNQSLSLDLLKEAFDFPLWVCRMPKFGRQNVLLAVDGSEPSYRIADHAGFILAGEPHHDITLLFVCGPKTPVPNPDFFDKYKDLVTGSGFPPQRIRTKSITATDIPKAILAEAEAGQYAVVGVGRTGSGKGLAKKIFFGSVSNDIFHNLTGAVMWVSQ
jgi:nucleotide-binding universal stress UspA family protein